MHLVLRGGILLALSALVACGGGGGEGIVRPPTTPPPPAGPAITGLTVAPATATLFVSQSVTLVPTPSTAGTGVSVQYAYVSSAPAVATVSNGVVTAVSAGNAVITVSATGSGTGFTTATQVATASIVVNNPPPVVVAISPTSLALNVGESGTLSVQITGGLSTPTLASCSSSNVAIVTAAVTGSSCRVTAVAAGNATVTASTSGGQQASAPISVTALPPALGTLTVTPTTANLTVAQSTTLVPNANPASAAVGVALTFASSATSVAVVSAAGVVTGVLPGSAVITVTAVGTGVGFTTTTRTATVPVTVSLAPPAFDDVLITPSSITLAAGQSVALQATPVPARAGVSLTFSYASNSPNTASVSANGVVSGNAPGNSVISVTVIGSGLGFTTATKTVNIPVTVSAAPPALTALSLSPSTATITVGQNTTLAPNATVGGAAVAVAYSYLSSTPSVATVSASGVVTGVTPGTSQITVTAVGSGSGFTTTTLTATAQITVAAVTSCVILDRTLDFTAAGTITASDCMRSGTRYQYFRVTTNNPRVVQIAAASTYDGVGVTAAIDTGLRTIFYGGTNNATGAYFLPAGTSLLGIMSTAGATGAYSATVVTQSEDVEQCRAVTIIGTLNSSQRLSANSCLGATKRFDRFLLFAPGRSCTIDMRVTGQAGSIADPYLEVWNNTGGTLVTFNDDASLVTVDSRIVMKECVDPAANFIDLRAQALNAGDFGAYVITVTFGPIIPGAPSVRAPNARASTCEVTRTRGGIGTTGNCLN